MKRVKMVWTDRGYVPMKKSNKCKRVYETFTKTIEVETLDDKLKRVLPELLRWLAVVALSGGIIYMIVGGMS